MKVMNKAFDAFLETVMGLMLFFVMMAVLAVAAGLFLLVVRTVAGF